MVGASCSNLAWIRTGWSPYIHGCVLFEVLFLAWFNGELNVVKQVLCYCLDLLPYVLAEGVTLLRYALTSSAEHFHQVDSTSGVSYRSLD